MVLDFLTPEAHASCQRSHHKSDVDSPEVCVCVCVCVHVIRQIMRELCWNGAQ